MMNKFAFYLTPHELTYFMGILQKFPQDFFDIHVAPAGKIITSFQELSPIFQSEINSLLDKGYFVKPLSAPRLKEYHNAVLSSSFLVKRQRHFNWPQLPPNSNLACLFHSTDAQALSHQFHASWYILAHNRQAQVPEPNKFINSSDATQKMMFEKIIRLPRKMINEYAWAGLYHLGDWEKKRLLPKDVLREELEKKLRTSLSSTKPVVAFLQDEFCHWRQIAEALERLAPHVNLIIKGSSIPEIRGTFVWPDRGYAPNLLRFASDFILAGYHSGTLASSTMLGLRTIPYYTTLIFKGGSTIGTRDNYKYYMPHHFKGRHVCVDILEQLNPPVNLLDTQAILERMENDIFWTAYRQKLPPAQKNIFGEYIIEGAAERAAKLLLRAFAKGSFGKDTAAVRLRPEYSEPSIVDRK